MPISSFRIEVFLNQVLKFAFEIPVSISAKQSFQSCFVSIASHYILLIFYISILKLINYVDKLLINLLFAIFVYYARLKFDKNLIMLYTTHCVTNIPAQKKKKK